MSPEPCVDNGSVLAGSRLRWMQVEIHCMLCGRLLGRLAEAKARRSAAATFSAAAIFRPAAAQQAPRKLHRGERLACQSCGGRGIMSDLEWFTTYDEPLDPGNIDRVRRGRRPSAIRRVRDQRLAELGLGG